MASRPFWATLCATSLRLLTIMTFSVASMHQALPGAGGCIASGMATGRSNLSTGSEKVRRRYQLLHVGRCSSLCEHVLSRKDIYLQQCVRDTSVLRARQHDQQLKQLHTWGRRTIALAQSAACHLQPLALPAAPASLRIGCTHSHRGFTFS